jgi:hypothetical protein
MPPKRSWPDTTTRRVKQPSAPVTVSPCTQLPARRRRAGAATEGATHAACPSPTCDVPQLQRHTRAVLLKPSKVKVYTKRRPVRLRKAVRDRPAPFAHARDTTSRAQAIDNHERVHALHAPQHTPHCQRQHKELWRAQQTPCLTRHQPPSRASNSERWIAHVATAQDAAVRAPSARTRGHRAHGTLAD